jgi:hypothetical protein
MSWCQLCVSQVSKSDSYTETITDILTFELVTTIHKASRFSFGRRAFHNPTLVTRLICFSIKNGRARIDATAKITAAEKVELSSMIGKSNSNTGYHATTRSRIRRYLRRLYLCRLRLGGVHHPRHKSGKSSTSGIPRLGRSCLGM